MSKTLQRSPGAVLHESMASSAKLASRTRTILSRQIAAIEKELSAPNLPPGRRLELVDALVGVLNALDHSVQASGKLLTAKHAPAIASETTSAQSVLDDLVKGTPARADDRR